MKLVKHRLANPLLFRKALIDWCYAKFHRKKCLSAGAMFKLLTPENVQLFKQLAESEINPSVLNTVNSKSSIGGHFADLEAELFAWFFRKKTLMLL